jgi:hypothetical protein
MTLHYGIRVIKGIPQNRRRCKDDLPSKKFFNKVNAIGFSMRLAKQFGCR